MVFTLVEGPLLGRLELPVLESWGILALQLAAVASFASLMVMLIGPWAILPTWLQAVSLEADQAARVLPDPGVVVVPIVAVHGAQVPWGKVVMNGVPIVPARRLPSMLRQLPAVLGPQRVVDLADQARVRLHAAA